MKQIGLRLSEDDLRALDLARGDVPREVFIRRAIRSRVERDHGIGMSGPSPGEAPPSEGEPAPAKRKPREKPTVRDDASAVTGHYEGCKCLKCERARGNVT